MIPTEALSIDGAPRLAKPIVALTAIGLLAAGVAASLFIGDVSIDAQTVLAALSHCDSHMAQHVIVRDWRLPRAAADILAGAALAVAGAVMQAVTRNPLASPGIMGLNTGASFSVLLAMIAWPTAGRGDLTAASIAGAAGGAGLVYGLGSLSRGGLTPVRLALTGMAVAALIGAVGDGLMIYNELGQDLLLWYGRGSEGAQWADIWLLFPLVGVSTLMALTIAPSLSVLSLGDQVAQGLGQKTRLTRFLAMTTALVLAGGAVAVVGPIGFIGLMSPHLARLFVGLDYRLVIPTSAACGALLMLAADIGARLATTPLRAPIPMGATTAAFGVPFFLYLACRRPAPSRGARR